MGVPHRAERAVSAYAETDRARTARTVRWCEHCNRHSILPGHRYLIHTLFPGHDACPPDRPVQLAECTAHAFERHEDYRLDVCGTYCHGIEPCARPFRHDGEHSCREEALAEIRRRADEAIASMREQEGVR